MFEENSSSALQQSVNQIKFIKWDVIQEGEVIFKEKPTVGLPEVSRLINSAISQLKVFSMQCRKNIAVEDNKKIMNIANFINIYGNIYTNITCDENDSK